MFDDIFGPLDDITRKPSAPEPVKDEWDTGQGAGKAWDSGEKENLWRTANQFWDTGDRKASIPVPESAENDPDYDPEPDEEFFDDDEEDVDRW